MEDHRPASLSRFLKLTILASLAVAILATAPTAGAVSSGDQYIPRVDKGGVSGADRTGLAVGVGSGPTSSAPAREAAILRDQQVAADDGAGTGVSVPGADFPLTLFVVIVGGVLAAALALRLLAPALDRRT
jgi:hypothetical protein